MKRRVIVVAAASLVLLLGGVVGAYAYDASKADVIAPGVRVGGVDVGGMDDDEARATLERRLAAQLARPLRIRYRKLSFTVFPRAAGAELDIEAMVREARERSREGNLVTRVVRHASGGAIEADVGLRIRFSRERMRTLVRRVTVRTDRPPRSARVTPTARGLRIIRSQPGVRVDSRQLARTLAARLADPRAPRLIRIQGRVVQPKRTTEELARRFPAFITIGRAAKRLRLYRHLRLVKTYEIAVEQLGHSTPTGLYKVETKAVNPAWHAPDEPWAGEFAGTIVPPGSPDNPIKARWLEFYNGAGIHGTDDVASLGTAASHGCIRMAIPDVIELYGLVPLNTPVYIG